MSESLRTIAEAAAYLNIPETTLRDKVTARQVPHTRIGRHVRFSEEHLAEIVAAGEQPVITAPARLQVVGVRPGQRRTHPPSGPSTPPPPPGPKQQDQAAGAA